VHKAFSFPFQHEQGFERAYDAIPHYPGLICISYGAELDALSVYFKRAPLHEAIGNNHLDLVKYLLEKGANPNIGNLNCCVFSEEEKTRGFCPFREAIFNSIIKSYQSKNLDIIKCLLESGANPNCWSTVRQLPTSFFIRLRYEERTDYRELLMPYIAKLDISTLFYYHGVEYDLDENPLVAAMKADNFHLIKSLLLKGEDPKELVNKVKEKLRRNTNNMEQRQNQNDPDYPSLLRNWLKLQIEFNLKHKSNELLAVSLSICNMCQPDHPLLQCQTLKDKCRKKIRYIIDSEIHPKNKSEKIRDITRIYDCINSLVLPRCLQYYLSFQKDLEVFDLNFSSQTLTELLGNK
jgi:hypothetical protein